MVKLGQIDDTCKPCCDLLIVADEDQRTPLLLRFLKKQLHEPVSIVAIQRRRWLIGQDNLRAANRRPGDRSPLLLADTQFGDGCGPTLWRC